MSVGVRGVTNLAAGGGGMLGWGTNLDAGGVNITWASAKVLQRTAMVLSVRLQQNMMDDTIHKQKYMKVKLVKNKIWEFVI